MVGWRRRGTIAGIVNAWVDIHIAENHFGYSIGKFANQYSGLTELPVAQRFERSGPVGRLVLADDDGHGGA